jgi:hypothetical protein
MDKPKPTSTDPKLVNFRTTWGHWQDFCAAAEAEGYTASQVLKAAMADFISKRWSPDRGEAAADDVTMAMALMERNLGEIQAIVPQFIARLEVIEQEQAAAKLCSTKD